VESPISLELTEIAVGGFLVGNVEVVVGEAVVESVGGLEPDFEVAELVRGESEGELVASALVPEGVEASEGVGDGDVEDEVGEGQEGDGDPAVAALEAGGVGVGEEDEGEEEEEDLEQLVELLFLQVDGSLLLEGLLEVQLDDGVQRLQCRFFRVLVGVVVMAFVVRH